MKTRMFLKNLSSKRGIIFAFAMIISAFIIPLTGLTSSTANAISDEQMQKCYDTFQGRDLAKVGITNEEKEFYNTVCHSFCKAAEGNNKIISCPNPTSLRQIQDAEVGPLVKLVCGDAPAGENAQPAYLECAGKVRAAYEDCDNFIVPIQGPVEDSDANTASCIFPRLANPKPSLANIKNAVTQGRAAAINAANAQIAEQQLSENKAKCEADGGTWKDNKCNAEENDTPERTCVIDGVGWILCPAINLMGNLVDGAYFLVSGLLKVQPLVVTGNTAGIYDAWSIMRNFANVAFVIAFLIIIFSQMTSVGVSNYGIKKMLPRLIIAAILVNVSFWLCAIAVDLSNISGASINDLFKGISKSLVKPCFDADPTACLGSPWDTGSTTWTKIASGAVLGTLGIGVALYVTLSALLPALVIALFAILTVFLVLTLRQALIILLIVVAPLAFVAYLLPNTESLFKKWRDLFQTLLLMYPIIGLIFGASSLASTIVMTSAANGDANLKVPIQIMGALISIVPLAITPIVMRAAGGLLNRFGGIVNNPNKGPKDRLMKAAQGRRDYRRNIANTRRQDRASGDRWLGKAANSVGPDGSRRQKTARWLAGSGVMAGVNQKRKYENAEAVQKSKEQSHVATRALADAKYAKHITAPTGSADMTKAYAIEAVEHEFKKDQAASKVIFEHEGTPFKNVYETDADGNEVRDASGQRIVKVKGLIERIQDGDFDHDQAKKHAAMQRYLEIANSDGVQAMVDHLGKVGQDMEHMDAESAHKAAEFQKAAGAILETHKLKPVDLSGSNLTELKTGTFKASEGERIEKTIYDGKVQAAHIAKMDVDEMARWNAQLSDPDNPAEISTLLEGVNATKPETIVSTYEAIAKAERDPRLNVNFGDRERKQLTELKSRLARAGGFDGGALEAAMDARGGRGVTAPPTPPAPAGP